MRRRRDPYSTVPKLLILTLSRSFGLLLSLNARLLIAFSLAKLGLDSRTLALPLETTERTVERLVLLDSDLSHQFPLPSLLTESSEQLLPQ